MRRFLCIISVVAVFLVSALPVGAVPNTIVVFSTPGVDVYGPIFSPISDPFTPNVDDTRWDSAPFNSAVAVSNAAWANIQGATWISNNIVPETAPPGTDSSWRKFHVTIDVDVPESARYLEGTLLVLADNAVNINLNGGYVGYWGKYDEIGYFRVYPHKGVNDLYFLVKNTSEYDFPAGGNPTGLAFKVIVGYYSPLDGQYNVVTKTTSLGGDSWEFEYTITNLTETGEDYTGLPYIGIDRTGLDGFFLDVPDDAVIHDVVVPLPYENIDGANWSFSQGGWIGIWGNGPGSIYPLGQPLVFKFQADNVAVGTVDATLTTFFYDQALRYPSEYNLIFQSYYTQITGPVPVPVEPLPPDGEIEVGGDIYPVSKVMLLIPWIGLVMALIIGSAIVIKYRRTQS